MKKLFLLLSLAVVVTSCWTHDGPPKTNGPAPEPHSGIFVCGIDTLFFNGDGGINIGEVEEYITRCVGADR